MSELVILANELSINADSVAYCANGAVVKASVEYASNTFTVVAYLTVTFSDENYNSLVYFRSSELTSIEYFLTSAGSKFLVQATTATNDIRY